MDTEEHLAPLQRGVESWNHWRQQHPELNPDLKDAYLSRADLNGANLSRANLSRTNLSGAHLSGADLSGAQLSGAYLSGADLSWAKLSGAQLSGANLSGADLRQANLSEADLQGAYLSGAKLSGAVLCQADLSQANLREADLRGADLSETQALATDFGAALLTGACLEDWSINPATQFEQVICDYIYLQSQQQQRRPRRGNFAAGQLLNLLQKTLCTAELSLYHGINWQAFVLAYQKLQTNYGNEDLAIQAIETGESGLVVIRLRIPPEANPADLQAFLKRTYELELKATHRKYRECFGIQDEKIALYHQKSADLTQLVQHLADRVFTLEDLVAPVSPTPAQAVRLDLGKATIDLSEPAQTQPVRPNSEPQNSRQLEAKFQQLLTQLAEPSPSSDE